VADKPSEQAACLNIVKLLKHCCCLGCLLTYMELAYLLLWSVCSCAALV
jgi:hypothetical protein